MPLFGGPPDVEKLQAKRNVMGLIKALDYPKSWDVRSKAAKALGEIGDARAVEALIVVLHKRDYMWEYSWKTAAEALGKMGDARAVAPLLKGLQSEDLQEMAAKSLGMLKDQRAIEPLVDAFRDVRSFGGSESKALREALVQFGPIVVEPMVTALQDKNWQVRKGVAEVLAALGWQPTDHPQQVLYAVCCAKWKEAVSFGADAVEPLVFILQPGHSTSSYDQEPATEALGQIGDRRAIEPLVTALQNSRGNVKVAAAKALINIDAQATVKLLLHHTNSSIRKAAAEALGEMRDVQMVESLMKALQEDKDWDVRRAAANALGKIGNSQAVEALATAMEHTDSAMRVLAADALGESRDDRAVKLLAIALQEGDERVLNAVVLALGKIGNARALQPLIAALQHEVGAGSRLARVGTIGWILVQFGVVTVEPLIAILLHRNSDRQLRSLAIFVLGQLEDVRAVPALITALQDEDESLRAEAARALGRIGDARVVEPMIITLQHEIETMRERYTAAVAKQENDRLWHGLHRVPLDQRRPTEEYFKELKEDVEAAIEVLGKITDSRAAEPLITYIALDGALSSKAVGALWAIFERHIASITQEDLCRAATLRDTSNVKYEVHDEAYNWILGANCSGVRQLARQELIRRGLEAYQS